MHDSSSVLAARLADHWFAGRVISVTWLNHYSALALLGAGMSTIASVDYVGIDGLFLWGLLGRPSHERTTADLVIPRLLPLIDGARIALVGGRRTSLDEAAKVITADLIGDGGSAIVDTRDGYGELPAVEDVSAWLAECRPDVVIVGLGVVLQDQWAGEVRARLTRGLVLTCGGFFDQVHQPNYYPAWSYPLRLNWAVRVVREPRRLWRRYSLHAVAALRSRQQLSAAIGELPGYRAYCAAITEGPDPRHNRRRQRRREGE